MTSKQRAYLKGLAMTMEPIFQIGKSSLTPENTAAVSEALEARELIKISVLQNCMDDPREIAEVLAERTHSQVVQVIGKKIVLYKEGKEKKKMDGVIYNIPGKAQVTVFTPNKRYFDGELPVTQFGTTECLVDNLFNKKVNTRVIFNPNTGGIVKIDKD